MNAKTRILQGVPTCLYLFLLVYICCSTAYTSCKGRPGASTSPLGALHTVRACPQPEWPYFTSALYMLWGAKAHTIDVSKIGWNIILSWKRNWVGLLCIDLISSSSFYILDGIEYVCFGAQQQRNIKMQVVLLHKVCTHSLAPSVWATIQVEEMASDNYWPSHFIYARSKISLSEISK